MSYFTYVMSCYSWLRQARIDRQWESLWRAATCPGPQYGQNVGDVAGRLHRPGAGPQETLQGSTSTPATTICKFPRRGEVSSEVYLIFTSSSYLQKNFCN